jgi:trigger factor
MAQVQETVKKGLQREFTVTVPQKDFEKNLQGRLTEMGKSARIPGFRPGKIPMDVLRQRFGQSARAEVLDQTVSEAANKALTERKLRPAMQPKIELVSIAEDKDLEFKLAVEILPEITPGDFASIQLEKPVAEITEKMVDDAIIRAAKAIREPEVVTESRGARSISTVPSTASASPA